jgi:hypothetical protein
MAAAIQTRLSLIKLRFNVAYPKLSDNEMNALRYTSRYRIVPSYSMATATAIAPTTTPAILTAPVDTEAPFEAPAVGVEPPVGAAAVGLASTEETRLISAEMRLWYGAATLAGSPARAELMTARADDWVKNPGWLSWSSSDDKADKAAGSVCRADAMPPTWVRKSEKMLTAPALMAEACGPKCQQEFG